MVWLVRSLMLWLVRSLEGWLQVLLFYIAAMSRRFDLLEKKAYRMDVTGTPPTGAVMTCTIVLPELQWR